MKPKSNGTASKEKSDTMMNLLDSTDSDVEWLNLPPIKGKKPKKRKAVKTMNNDNIYTCTLWCFLKGFLVFSVIVAICLISIVITWMSGEISDLRGRLKAVESKSDGSVQSLNTFTVQLSDVNKTVQGIKGGKNSLSEVIKNISAINQKISQLTERVDRLSASLEAAPELKQIPDKLLTVSKTVADLGSEVGNMKVTDDTFNQFMKSANTKLDELSNKMDEIDMSSKTPDDALSPDLANLVQAVPGQLSSLNITLLTQMSLLQSTLIEHEAKFGQLENTTATLAKSLSALSGNQPEPGASSSDLKKQIEEILQTVLKKNTSKTGSDVSIDQTTMNQLLGNMDNLTTTVQELKENYQKMGKPDSSSDGSAQDSDRLTVLLTTFEEGVTDKMEMMNKSVVKLRSDFDLYSGIIVKHTNQLVKVEHNISELHRFILASPIAPGQNKEETSTTGSPESKVTLPPEGGNSASPTAKAPKTNGDMEGNGEEGGNSASSTTETPQTKGDMEASGNGEEGGTKKLPAGVTTSTPSTSTPSTSTLSKQQDLRSKTVIENPDIVSVPRISNMEDLEDNFYHWDRTGNGKVRYDDLPGYLGPHTPAEDKLKKFDANNDGLYSLAELAAAFGYNMDDLPADSPYRLPGSG